MIKPNKHSLAISLILSAAAVSVLLIGLNTVYQPDELSWTSWGLYEWLINYQAGFVRRGLIGELIHQLFFNAEVKAMNYLAFLLGVLYVGFFTQLILVNRVRLSAGLLLVFAPTGFVWMAIANEYYFRKEMLFYIAILSVAAAYRYWRNRPTKGMALLVLGLISLFSLVLPFVHEAYVFFCGLIFYLIIQRLTTAAYGARQALLLTRLFIAVNILLFLLMSAFKGNVQISQSIWTSLSATARHFSANDEISGGIASISWSLLGGVAMPVQAVLSGMGSYYLLPLALVFIIIGYLFAEKAGKSIGAAYSNPVFIANFTLVFATFLPLFILGWDWGRWVVGIFVVLTVMIYSDLLIALNPQQLSILRAFLQKNARTLFVCAVLLLSVVTKTPECCISGSGGTLLNNKLVKLAIAEFKQLKNAEGK